MKTKTPPATTVPPAAAPPQDEGLGERLLSLKQVREKIGAGTSTIYRWMLEKTFPEPLQVTDTMVRWRMSDVDAWITAKATSARLASRRGQRKKNRVSSRV